MRYCITGDWHCHEYPADGDGDKLSLILDEARYMIHPDRGVDYLVHSGDLYHTRKNIPTGCLAKVSSFLRDDCSHLAEVHIVDGNHDMTPSGDGLSAVQALDRLANVRAYGKPMVRDIGGVRFAFLPYCEDPEEVRRLTRRLADQGGQILIAHLGLGDPRLARPTDYEIPGCINLSDLNPDKFRFVFLGHYHRFNQLSRNAWYVGSPLQLSFSESADVKGHMYLDVPDASDPTTWTTTFVENTRSPRYIQLDALAMDAAVSTGSAGIRPGDRVKVKATTKEQRARAVEIIPGATVAYAPEVTTEIRLDASKRDLEIVADYASLAASRNGIDADMIPELIIIGQEIVNASVGT